MSFSSGLVLSVKTPVLAGAPVVLAPKPHPHTATSLKGTVDMSRDKTCHMSHGRQQTPPTTDTSTPLTYHDRSHHKAEELRLSRLPSWRKRLAVQAEETTLPPSEDHQRCSSLCSQTAQAAGACFLWDCSARCTMARLYSGHHWDPAGCSVYSGTSL